MIRAQINVTRGDHLARALTHLERATVDLRLLADDEPSTSQFRQTLEHEVFNLRLVRRRLLDAS